MAKPKTHRPPPRVPRAAPSNATRQAPAAPAPAPQEEEVVDLAPEEVQTIPPVAPPSMVAVNIPPLPPPARVPRFKHQRSGRPATLPAPPPKTKPKQRELVIGYLHWALAAWWSENPSSEKREDFLRELVIDFPELKHVFSTSPQPIPKKG